MKSVRLSATKIVSTLQKAGFIAYFAGGWVRDYLLGRPSNDIDIATSAHPEEVMRLFPHSIAVGVQFGVVRVRFHHHEFEIATFRSEDQYIDGRRPASVSLHSSPQEDAQRRDFTINGMFYDPVHRKVYDYVGGKKDLEAKILRTIGSPYDRFKEDRLRIIRAIRFKNVFSLGIEKNTWQAVCEENHHVAGSVSPERIWQELDKMLQKGVFHPCLEDMKKAGLLFHLFPSLKKVPQEVLEESFSRLLRYKKKSLAVALCLLLPVEARDSVVKEYKLSTKEKLAMTTYSRLEKSLPLRPHDELLAELLSLPEIEKALDAYACTKKAPRAFVKRYQEKQNTLHFWVQQLKTGAYLLGGDEFKKLGISPGKQMGSLIKKAFALSLKQRIRNKGKLLSLLRKEGSL